MTADCDDAAGGGAAEASGATAVSAPATTRAATLGRDMSWARGAAARGAAAACAVRLRSMTLKSDGSGVDADIGGGIEPSARLPGRSPEATGRDDQPDVVGPAFAGGMPGSFTAGSGGSSAARIGLRGAI